MNTTYKTYTTFARMSAEDKELETYYQQQARAKKAKAQRQARRAATQGGGNWLGFTREGK